MKDYPVKTNYEDKLTIKSIISDLTDFNVEIDSFSVNPYNDNFEMKKIIAPSVKTRMILSYSITFITYYVDDKIVNFKMFMEREDEFLKYYMEENNLIGDMK